jgi:hypothetical protein
MYRAGRWHATHSFTVNISGRIGDDMKDKSPFVKYTAQQVADAEAINFVILLGHDLFSYEGRYTFVKEDAELYQQQIMEGLIEILGSGTEKEIEEAEVCLFHLKILPFRLN